MLNFRWVEIHAWCFHDYSSEGYDEIVYDYHDIMTDLMSICEVQVARSNEGFYHREDILAKICSVLNQMTSFLWVKWSFFNFNILDTNKCSSVRETNTPKLLSKYRSSIFLWMGLWILLRIGPRSMRICQSGASPDFQSFSFKSLAESLNFSYLFLS